MKKVKEIFKKNYKFMIGVILGLTLASPIVQAANYLFASNQVSYDNSTSGLTADNVKDALDELYERAGGSSAKGFAKYLTSLSAGDTVLADDGTGDHNMRYMGASPNNYVTFAGEEWRVIGVFNNIDNGTGKKEARVKIIKSAETSCNSNVVTNIWKTSPLATTLQGLSYASNSMVEDAVWYLGDSGYTLPTAKVAYDGERGTTVVSGNDPTWKGKVGLMYPSDYGFASSGCKDGIQNLYNYNNSTCSSTNWLYKSISCTTTQNYLLSPVSSGTVHYVSKGGSVLPGTSTVTSSTELSNNVGIIPLMNNSDVEVVPLYVCDYYYYQPVVYLKADVVCTNCSDSDAGTSGNPFKIQ